MSARRARSEAKAAETEEVVDEPTANLAVISLVDSALGVASRREFLRRDEAIVLLRDAGACAQDPALAAAAASIVNDATVSFGEDELLDQHRVLDPLLDIRSLVRRHGLRSSRAPSATDESSAARTGALTP